MSIPPIKAALAKLGAMAAAAMLTLACAPAAAQTPMLFRDIRVANESPPNGDTYFGYAEYAFTVTNTSPGATRVVTLSIPRESHGGRGHRLARISRTFEMPPLSTRRVALWQPPLPVNGGNAEMSVDGARMRETIPLGVSHGDDSFFASGWRRRHSYGGNPGRSTVLVSRAVRRRDFEAARPEETEAESGSRHSPSRRVELVEHDFPPGRWSQNWLGFSAYGAVVASGGDWEAMGGETRTALEDYVRLGGTLVVVDEWTPPKHWRLPESSDATLGFGRVIRSPDRFFPSIWGKLMDGGANARVDTWNQNLTPQAANSAFPLVDNLNIPVRGMFFLLLLFAILAGPVNMFVFARIKRRSWILWTTPTLALLFCGALFAYNVLSEGFTTTVRINSVTIIDQEARRAATLGWLGYYAPLTPRHGLRFDYDTELTPQLATDSWRGRDDGRAASVDWSDGQRLQSGWLAPRVPAFFRVRRAVPESRRLRFSRGSDGSLTVINGLGVEVEQLLYADAKGAIHRLDGLLAAGAEAALVDEFNRVAANADQGGELLDVYSNQENWRFNSSADFLLDSSFGGWEHGGPLAHDFDSRPQFRSLLADRGYVAVVKPTPFLDHGLEGRRVFTRNSRGLVVGIGVDEAE